MLGFLLPVRPSRASTPKPPRRARPKLEALEDRATPAVINLTTVADNTLYEDSTGNLSNGAGDHFYVGNTAQAAPAAARRGLLKFDLTSIPAGSTINSATLTLRVTKVPSGGANNPIGIHKATAAWGEGTSDAGTGGTGSGEGDGTQAATGDATWLFRFFNTDSWATVGGDFDPTASSSLTVGGLGSYTWTGLGADVQQWFSNPATNLGWLLRGDEVTSKSAKQFDTRENPTAANRPRLTIDFTPPPADLTVDKSHAGTFTQGDPDETYTIVVSNVGSGPTSGLVTVTDTVPDGMTPTAANNGLINGWNVSTSGLTVTATRTDALNPTNSYPPLPIVVAVAFGTPATLTNTATVAGGGETNTNNNSDDDPTTINPPTGADAPQASISGPSQSLANQAATVTYTVTYTDPNGDLATVTLSPADVILNGPGITADVAVSGSGNTRTVTLTNITGDGTLGISLAAGTASDLVGNQAGAAGPSATFEVDNTPPAITFTGPSVATTAAGPVGWLVDVADANLVTPVNLTPSQVTLIANPATITADVVIDFPSASQVRVRLTNIRGGAGTLAFRLPAGWAADQAGNAVASADSPPVTVTGSRKLRLSVAGPTGARVGAVLTYLVAWRNAGNQQADGAEVIVSLPAGTTFDAVRSSPGWTAIGNGKFRLDLGNLAAGAKGRARFVVRVGPVVPPGGYVAFGASLTDDQANDVPVIRRGILTRIGRPRVG